MTFTNKFQLFLLNQIIFEINKCPIGETDIDDKATELKLLRCDDFMVTWLLSQLHDGWAGSQPQAGHVRFTATQEAMRE